MGSDWKSQSLESIASFSQGLQVSVDAQFSNYKNGLSQFIRIVDFTNDAEPPRYIETPSDRYFIESDDIVMIRYGSQTAGKVVRGKSGVLANNMFKISIDVDHIDKGFLFHYLTSPTILNYLTGTQSSSTMPAITFGMLKPIQIQFPVIKQQVRIAEIIDSLDDKIELNRRMNETLEGMAQALFKSWFVDFDPVIDNALAAGNPIPEPLAQRAETRRQAIANGTANREAAQAFPASFCFTEELGWIPEGWEVKNWNEIATITKGKSYKSDELQDSKTALVTLKSFNRGGGYRLDGLKSYIGKFKPEQVVTSGDLVIAYTDVTQAADVIGKPALVIPDSRFETLVISLDVAVVKPVSDHLKYYLYGMARSKEFEERMLSFTSGTTVLHLAKNAIPEHSSAIPSEKLLNDYHNVADSNFQRIVGNIEESQTLAKLRDVLMPKLISGELRIPQAEKMVEEAIA